MPDIRISAQALSVGLPILTQSHRVDDMAAGNLYEVGVVALVGDNGKYVKYDATADVALSVSDEQPGLGALFHVLDAGNGKVKVKTENGRYWRRSEAGGESGVRAVVAGEFNPYYCLFDIELSGQDGIAFKVDGVYVSLSTGSNGATLEIGKRSLEPSCIFGIHRYASMLLTAQQVSFLGANSKYVRYSGDTVYVDDAAIDASSTFSLLDAGSGKVRVQAGDGRYWSTSSQQVGVAYKIVLIDGQDDSGVFAIELDTSGGVDVIRLKNADGLYLSIISFAPIGWNYVYYLAAAKQTADAFCNFTLSGNYISGSHPVSFLGANNRYIRYSDNTVNVDGGAIGADSTFDLQGVGGGRAKVKANDGRYWSAQSFNRVSLTDGQDEYAVLTLELDNSGKSDVIRFRNKDGWYLSYIAQAAGNGTEYLLIAQKNPADVFCNFTLTYDNAVLPNSAVMFTDSNGKRIHTTDQGVLNAGDGMTDSTSSFDIVSAGNGKYRIRAENGLYWQSSAKVASSPLVVDDLSDGGDVYSLFDIEYHYDGNAPFFRLKDAHGLYVITKSADGYPATLSPWSVTPDVPYCNFGIAQIDELTLQSKDAMPLLLNQPHTLTATYTGAASQPVQGAKIYWSDDASDQLTFNPNPSVTAGNGQATTAVTGYGITSIKSNIIARAYNADTGRTCWGDLPATFTPQGFPQLGAAYVTLDVVEALPLAEGGRNMLVATYRLLDGTPLANHTLTWTTDQPASRMTLESASTLTDANGVCTNVVDTKQSGDDFIGTVTVSTRNSETNNLDAAQTGVAFTSNVVPLPGAGTLSLQLPTDVATFYTGQWYDVTLTYTTAQNTPAGSRTVTWAAYPGDQLVFEQYTTKTGPEGKSANRVMASGSQDISAALMTVRAFNATTGAADAGVLTASFQANVAPARDTITVESSETPPLELNAPHTLTARCTRNGKPAPAGTAVAWSGDPADRLQFAPALSLTNADGVATTAVTAFGTASIAAAQIYARGYNDATDTTTWGKLPLSFRTGKAPQPGAAYISMESVDPVPLGGFSWHTIVATYRNVDGTPLGGRTVNWSVDAASAGKVRLDTTSTRTDDDGVTTNRVVRLDRNQNLVVTLNASTANLVSGATDSGQIGLEFHIDANLPDAGYMALQIQGGTTLTEGQWYELTSTYTNAKGELVPATTVTWVGYPSTRLKFESETSRTGPDGVARNRVMGLGPGDFNGAIASTFAFNETTGTNDSGSLPLALKAPVVALSGISIARPYATTPSVVGGMLDPKNPRQMIRCSVTTGQPRQQVNLSSPGPTITMFDMDGKELPSQQGEGYVITSDGNGNAAFQLGSYLLNISPLTAKTDGASVSTQLTFGEIADEVAGSLPGTLAVAGLVRSNLAIPTDPASEPVFGISLPQASGLALRPSDPVSIILNDRLVFAGTAEQVLQPASVDVAYAVLRNGGQRNTLACLSGDARESNITTFTASGVPRTGPLTTTRTLAAPSLVGPAGTVFAKDVVNGLSVTIPVYAGASVGDGIVLYCYLAGKDPVSNASITNVLRIAHTISGPADPLLKQQPLSVVVPQAYLSGYGGGTLQIDYRVTLANRGQFVQWSGITSINLSTVV
jgi:hypothetical protein